MTGCTAALSWMTHAAGGAVLNLGRRRRRASKAIRQAARERDQGRCRYPGCESRRVDLHHIRHWSNGGQTSLENLVSLCRRHHRAVHDRGYLIAVRPDGTFARSSGSRLRAQALLRPLLSVLFQPVPGRRAKIPPGPGMTSRNVAASC